jgi:outer membrane protein assembly factor BamD
MKYSFLFIVSLIFLASCSNYQKALKSDSLELKTKVADSLYEAGKYSKAINLYERVVPQVRGTDSAAPLALKYANALYFDGRYPESGYQFETFKNSYVTSPKREYATFMVGKSLTEMSPVYSKDQTETQRAMSKFQDYINAYPNGEYLEEANELTNELRYKLDKKDYEIAAQYHKRAPFSRGGYIAAITTFENYILDHPGSEFQDDAQFYILDSQFKFAINSVPSLIDERLITAKEYYNIFANRYPNSEYKEEADIILREINTFLN